MRTKILGGCGGDPGPCRDTGCKGPNPGVRGPVGPGQQPRGEARHHHGGGRHGPRRCDSREDQKNGIGGPPRRFETLEQIGYQRSYSERNTATDSAAAASAWACGEKFVNDEFCQHGDGRPHNLSLLELAQVEGWGPGW